MTTSDVPRYEDNLAVFLGDLRTWVFGSQSKAAQHFGLTHSTVSRYENGQLKPDPGFIACLARLLDDRLRAAGSEVSSHRPSILSEVNHALHACYICPPALRSWQELERLADSYRPQGTVSKPWRVDWGDAPETGPLYGREGELSALRSWLTTDRCRLVAVAGLGGVGKTSLAARLVEQLQDQFEFSVWRSLRNAPPLTDTLRSYLRGLQVPVDDTEPPAVERDLTRLLEALQQRHCLLVLDNVESVLLTGAQSDIYRDGYEAYGELLRRMMEGRHQSSLLLTTRELPAELGHVAPTAIRTRVWHLDGLDAVEGARLLRDLGLTGSDKECFDMVARCSGNPLALKLIADLVRDVFDGDLARYLGQGAQMPASIQRLLDQQISRLSPSEQTVLAWLAVERAPVTPEALSHDVVAESPGAIAECLQALGRRSLAEHDRRGFFLRNVVLECVTDRLVDEVRREIMAEHPAMLRRVPLLTAQAVEPIRLAQTQQLLQPLAAALQAALTPAELAEKLARCLDIMRSETGLAPGYGGGNLLNLLLHLGLDVGNYDFSGLTVWQAYLRNRSLHRANLSGADLERSVFSDAFAGINALALSPDGRLLAVATNRRVQLWDLADARLVAALADRPDLVWSVAFTPDGKMLISGGDRAISVWDVARTCLLSSLQGHTHWIWSVAVSPSGALLASGSADHTIRLWSLADGECQAVLTGHEGAVRAVAFSPDGTVLASGSTDGTAGLWDVTEHRLCRRWRTCGEEVLAVAFSPDNGVVATGGADGYVTVWDTKTGELRQSWPGHQAPVSSLFFMPDGQQVISGSYDHTVEVWRLGEDQPDRTLRGHHQAVRAIALHSDGVTLASGGYDQSIRFWNLPTGQPLYSIDGFSFQVKALAFSPEGSYLATGGTDQVVRVWRLASGQALFSLPGHTRWVSSVAISPGGRLLASGSFDRSVRLWDVERGCSVGILDGSTGWVWCVAFSPGGDVLASGSADGQVHLWDVATGQLQATLPGHARGVRCLSFTHDGTVLASGGEDGWVKLWDIRERRSLATCAGHEDAVTALAFSRDDHKLASVSEDGTLRLWEVPQGRAMCALTCRRGPLSAVVFRADDGLMVSGEGLLLRQYEPGFDQVLPDLAGSDEPLAGNAFDATGDYLATGSLYGAVHVWDLRRGEHRQTLQITRPYEGMDITGSVGLTLAQRAALIALGAVDRAPQGEEEQSQ